jgi:5-methylcytosine-specific restriction endonuclease McrA
MKGLLIIIIIALLLLSFAEARTARSYKARAEFKRLQPCPATGKSSGPCPGWEIDHVVPLYKDGADSPANMQWLKIEQHREKHRKRK